MMLVIFATLFAALLAGQLGRRPLAVALLAATLVLSIGLFLWEVWSPETGFGMPWIRT